MTIGLLISQGSFIDSQSFELSMESKEILNTPVSCPPAKINFCTGDAITPKTGLPFLKRAILTANSPFLLMNSLVPSSGSMHQHSIHFLRSAKGIFSVSSPVMGILSGSRCL